MADERPPSSDSASGEPIPRSPEVGEWELEAEDVEQKGSMNFLDHLEDLRWTLGKSVAAFFLGCVVVALGLSQFADLLRWPYDFATAGRTGVTFEGLINTSFLGVFSVVLQLMLIGGLALSLPFILFFVGQFIAPGLNDAEMRLLIPGCVGAIILFLAGSTFSFFILLPAGLKAAIYFNDMLGFDLLITASSYYGILTWATLGVGTAFEFPLLLLLLIYMGVLKTAQLRRWRRHAIVVFLVVSALVTPTPDPVTFLFLAIPLWGLYELSILLGHRVERHVEHKRSIADLD